MITSLGKVRKRKKKKKKPRRVLKDITKNKKG
jgi:hypothetical protein